MPVGKVYPVMLIACAAMFLAAVLIIISFATPYWLVSDGNLPASEEKFQRLGLWEVCFRNFKEVKYRFDVEFRGCKWIFDEEYDILYNLLHPPFFIAVQFFFTLGFVVLLLACLLVLALILCLSSGRDVLILKILGGLNCFAGCCTLIAVITFGALGDERNWMPNPDNNFLSWSFGFGVVGVVLEFTAGALFFVEANLTRKRQRQREQQIFTLNQMQSKA